MVMRELWDAFFRTFPPTMLGAHRVLSDMTGLEVWEIAKMHLEDMPVDPRVLVALRLYGGPHGRTLGKAWLLTHGYSLSPTTLCWSKLPKKNSNF
jgi:hypothetical protein